MSYKKMVNKEGAVAKIEMHALENTFPVFPYLLCFPRLDGAPIGPHNRRIRLHVAFECQPSFKDTVLSICKLRESA